MTNSDFLYMDPTSFKESDEPFVKPWSKVDGPGQSFREIFKKYPVQDLRGQENQFNVNVSGFGVYEWPVKEKDFTDDQAVQTGYVRVLSSCPKQHTNMRFSIQKLRRF